MLTIDEITAWEDRTKGPRQGGPSASRKRDVEKELTEREPEP